MQDTQYSDQLEDDIIKRIAQLENESERKYKKRIGKMSTKLSPNSNLSNPNLSINSGKNSLHLHSTANSYSRPRSSSNSNTKTRRNSVYSTGTVRSSKNNKSPKEQEKKSSQRPSSALIRSFEPIHSMSPIHSPESHNISHTTALNHSLHTNISSYNDKYTDNQFKEHFQSKKSTEQLLRKKNDSSLESPSFLSSRRVSHFEYENNGTHRNSNQKIEQISNISNKKQMASNQIQSNINKNDYRYSSSSSEISEYSDLSEFLNPMDSFGTVEVPQSDISTLQESQISSIRHPNDKESYSENKYSKRSPISNSKLLTNPKRSNDSTRVSQKSLSRDNSFTSNDSRKPFSSKINYQNRSSLNNSFNNSTITIEKPDRNENRLQSPTIKSSHLTDVTLLNKIINSMQKQMKHNKKPSDVFKTYLLLFLKQKEDLKYFLLGIDSIDESTSRIDNFSRKIYEVFQCRDSAEIQSFLESIEKKRVEQMGNRIQNDRSFSSSENIRNNESSFQEERYLNQYNISYSNNSNNINPDHIKKSYHSTIPNHSNLNYPENLNSNLIHSHKEKRHFQENSELDDNLNQQADSHQEDQDSFDLITESSPFRTVQKIHKKTSSSNHHTEVQQKFTLSSGREFVILKEVEEGVKTYFPNAALTPNRPSALPPRKSLSSQFTTNYTEDSDSSSTNESLGNNRSNHSNESIEEIEEKKNAYSSLESSQILSPQFTEVKLNSPLLDYKNLESKKQIDINTKHILKDNSTEIITNHKVIENSSQIKNDLKDNSNENNMKSSITILSESQDNYSQLAIEDRLSTIVEGKFNHLKKDLVGKIESTLKSNFTEDNIKSYMDLQMTDFFNNISKMLQRNDILTSPNYYPHDYIDSPQMLSPSLLNQKLEGDYNFENLPICSSKKLLPDSKLEHSFNSFYSNPSFQNLLNACGLIPWKTSEPIHLQFCGENQSHCVAFQCTIRHVSTILKEDFFKNFPSEISNSIHSTQTSFSTQTKYLIEQICLLETQLEIISKTFKSFDSSKTISGLISPSFSNATRKEKQRLLDLIFNHWGDILTHCNSIYKNGKFFLLGVGMVFL